MRLPKRSALGLFAVLAHVHLAVPMAAAGEPAATNDPPAAGGECSFSCVPGTSGCPLTVPGPRCDYITELVKGNLANAVADKSSGRSVPNAALCQLLAGCPQLGDALLHHQGAGRSGGKVWAVSQTPLMTWRARGLWTMQTLTSRLGHALFRVKTN